MADFDFNDTAKPPSAAQEFLLENLCGLKEGGGYTPPATRSASKRWKRIHEQSMMLRLEEMHAIKKQNAQMSKEAARKIIRKIPVEVLAKEWLSKEDATVDMRAYLVDQVLPTLILGVERLLKEVDEKGLSATNRFEPEFNPLNFLAQYLMRNNPRYSNFAEASPYVRGLREVSEEIKKELFTFEDNRLARIKAEARRKRTEREKVEQQQREERERRQAQLVVQFQEWNVPTDNNRVELSLLQNALRSFAEIAEQLPAEVREVAKFGHPLEPTDETGRTLAVKEFAQYISLFVEDLPSEVFQQFMVHMSKCAAAHRASAERENRRIILTNLFLLCDHGGLGLLDRHRILTLFEQYWDLLKDTLEPKGTLRNPRRWPVVEVDEVDDTMFYDNEEDDGGLTDVELPVAKSQMNKISTDLNKQLQQSIANDKQAMEKWKMEQLTEKSEGMRLRMYKYAPTDFMTLEEYSLYDTLEAPKNHFLRDDVDLDNHHDLYLLTRAATAAARVALFESQMQSFNQSALLPQSDESNTVCYFPLRQNFIRDSHNQNAVTAPDDHRHDGSLSPTPKSISEFNKRQLLKVRRLSHESETQDASTSMPRAQRKLRRKKRLPPVIIRGRDSEIFDSEESDSIEESCLEMNNILGEQMMKKSPLPSILTRSGVESLTRKSDGSESDETDNAQSKSLSIRNIVNQNNNRPRPQKGNLSVQNDENQNSNQLENEETDVDITGEMAGENVPESQSKSAMKPVDPTTQPTATGRISVTFAGNTAFDREKTANELELMLLSSDYDHDAIVECVVWEKLRFTQSRSQSQMSVFDETVLNVSQFVQLTETFLGHHPHDETFHKLVNYLKGGYEETEEEKMERLVKARKEAISAKRKLLMDNLFDKWDNDGSGFLEMDDLEEVMMKYKDGQEHDTIKRAQQSLKKKSKFHDQRLNRKEFRQFVEIIVDDLPGAESFEYFVEFLTNSVERSYAERIRGEARKKWLSAIINASQVSGVSLDPVYKAVFQALYRDAEAHGGEKKISSSIALLEKNSIDPERGDLLLRYASCTPEDCQYMLGKALFSNQKGISFQAVETGKPILVPRLSNHGNVFFWNYDRMPEEREGSFIVVPLKDNKKRVFGVLGIDTLIDPHKKAIFITHEIQFFQGVAQSFSIAYHSVDMRRKLLRITESAISWIQRRCPHIAEITVYMVEPSPKETGGSLLRKMMTTDSKGMAVQVTETVRLERKDNLFRDYLFKCMDNSETVAADAYGERHIASPLRDNEGKAIGVVDISIGEMKRLPPYENKEAQRMLRLLQQAHREITKEAEGDETTRVLDAEKDDEGRMDIMFDRLMLMELRENVAKLDPSSFAELKSYHEPPKIIHHILQATLALFYLDKAGEGGFDDWTTVKNYITPELMQQIKTYDPTVAAQLVKTEKVERFLKSTFTVPHGEVAKHGSIPAQQLYNWVFVCISLIEHTRKMRENAEANVMIPAKDDDDGVQAPASDKSNDVQAAGDTSSN